MASKTLFILGILSIAFLLISSEVCAKEVDADEVVDKEAAQTEQYGGGYGGRGGGYGGGRGGGYGGGRGGGGGGCRHRRRCCGHRGCYCCSQTEFDALAKAQVNTEAMPHN